MNYYWEAFQTSKIEQIPAIFFKKESRYVDLSSSRPIEVHKHSVYELPEQSTFSSLIIEPFHDYNGAFRSFTLILFHDYDRSTSCVPSAVTLENVRATLE